MPKGITDNEKWQEAQARLDAGRRADAIARRISTAPPMFDRDIETLKALLDEHPRLVVSK